MIGQVDGGVDRWTDGLTGGQMVGQVGRQSVS